MDNNEVKKVFFIIAIFLTVGLLTVFVTHNKKIEDTNTESRVIINNQDYAKEAKLWLDSVAQDYSLENITKVRQELLDFRSPDKMIGQVHISLFLAFDSWEKYLTTKDDYYKIQTSNHLILAGESMPDLSPDINNLQNILSNV